MTHFKDYKFFRSFSAKVEGWPLRKAEAFWRKLRENKIAGGSWFRLISFFFLFYQYLLIIDFVYPIKINVLISSFSITFNYFVFYSAHFKNFEMNIQSISLIDVM